MKTAISLPDQLFDRVDRYARRRKLTRSGVLAAAARAFLAQSEPETEDATEAWNNAIDEGGQPGKDPAAVAARRHAAKAVRSRARERG